MGSSVEVFCEDWKGLLKKVPALQEGQVFLRSEELYDLLVPRSRERHDGVRLNLFDFAEWRHGLENQIFFNLVEQEELSVAPEKVSSYIDSLLELFDKEEGSFPFAYFIRDAKQPASAPTVSQYELKEGVIEAGYDHCLAQAHDVWYDLRGQGSYDALGSDGIENRLLIVRQTVKEAFGSVFQTVQSIAATAQEHDLTLRFISHRQRTAASIADIEKDKTSDPQSEEDQIRSYMKMVEEIPVPTPDEEEDLVRKIELFGDEGLAARRRLKQGYFRLVVSLATKYLERGVRLLDMIPLANEALNEAVESYDFNCGISFSNYATWRIESDLQELVGEGESAGGISESMRQKLEQAKALSDRLAREKGRNPSERELAEAMGIDVEELRRVFEQV